MQVFAGMDFVAHVDPGGIERIQDRRPAAGQLVERGLHQSRRTLRPGVDVRPRQRAGKGTAGGQAEVLRCPRRQQHLLHRPGSAGGRVVANLGGREAVEGDVVGRMHRDQLPLQVGGQLGQFDIGVGQDAAHLVAVRLALGGPLQVEQARVPGRDLHAGIAEFGGPARNRGQAVERACVTRELREKDRRPLDRPHGSDLPRHRVIRCGQCSRRVRTSQVGDGFPTVSKTSSSTALTGCGRV